VPDDAFPYILMAIGIAVIVIACRMIANLP